MNRKASLSLLLTKVQDLRNSRNERKMNDT